MKSKRILSLANYLAASSKSYNEIAKYIVMTTLSEEKFKSIMIKELMETGVVSVLGGFGWGQLAYDSFTDIDRQAKFPITDAITKNEVVIKQNNEEFYVEYPLMVGITFLPEWASLVAIPVAGVGGMILFSPEPFELTEVEKLFLMAVGSLVGLYASRLPVELTDVAYEVKHKIDLPKVPLTDRQFVIAGLLERGFNNAQIGLEIGYSESLVRQETVAIYRKLQVTGRQAMQAIKTLHLENSSS